MNNRWWEYYTIRYFVGSVVGAGVVLFLNYSDTSPYSGSLTSLVNLKDSAFLGISLVAAIGFAFCYLASAPMLTFHATRMHMRIPDHRMKSWLLLCVLLVFFTVGIALIKLPVIPALLVGIILAAQIYLIVHAGISQCKEIEKFYRKLAVARINGESSSSEKYIAAVPEYVTSYRHLREHANAYLIIVFEAILAYTLYSLETKSDGFVLMVIWVFPPCTVWGIASVLEARFADDPSFENNG